MAAGLDNHLRMPVVWSSDMHGVDVIAGKNVAVVIVCLAILVAILGVCLGLALVHGTFAHITNRHILDIVLAKKCTVIASTHISYPNATHHDAVTGGGSVSVTKCGCGDNGRKANSGCRSACCREKLTASGLHNDHLYKRDTRRARLNLG